MQKNLRLNLKFWTWNSRNSLYPHGCVPSFERKYWPRLVFNFRRTIIRWLFIKSLQKKKLTQKYNAINFKLMNSGFYSRFCSSSFISVTFTEETLDGKLHFLFSFYWPANKMIYHHYHDITKNHGAYLFSCDTDKVKKTSNNRSSHPEVFCKKGVLRNFTNFTGKHLCQSLFFNKVAVSHLVLQDN